MRTTPLMRLAGAMMIALLLVSASLPTAGAEAPGAPPALRLAQPPVDFLTGPNPGNPVDVALAHVRDAGAALGLDQQDLADLTMTDSYTTAHNGVTHVYLRQRYAGIEVFGANVNVNVAADGSVISMGQALIPGLAKAVNAKAPALSPVQAVEAAASSLGLQLTESLAVMAQTDGADQATVLSDGGISLEPIPAKLMYQPVAGGEVRLAWDVTIYELDALHRWSMRVDALDGKVLDQFDFVISDAFDAPAAAPQRSVERLAMRWTEGLVQPEVGGGQYNVLPLPVESPSHGSRSLVSDPANATASPYGWHDINGAAGAEYTTTQGNNAHAYTDTDNNNSPDAGSSPSGGASLLFDFPLDLGQAPSTYRPAAVTNLFYWNNLVHDVFYRYGFDEVSGNFQENNYGRGGAGSDYVYAEAQDGGGTNNANFATPVDGGNPRMQMYVWNSTTPNRDGDFDNGIIVHEYGHGISIRLTGGPATSSCLNNQEQAGEGWSDYFGIVMTIEPGDAGTDRRGVGTYALGQATTGTGIRAYPYSTDLSIDPRTYDAIKTAAVPHGVGSVWAAMVWEMTWALIDRYGFTPDLINGTGGNTIALQLVVDGLKLQPCSPGFVDARNAILQADQVNNGGANQCLIWQAFAKRGLGYSATQGSSSNRADGVQAFDLPVACQQVLRITKTASPSPATAGAPLTYSLLVENATTGSLANVVVTDNLPVGVSYVDGSATCDGSQSAGVVTFTLGTMAAGASQTCTFQVVVDGGLGTVTFFADTMENGAAPWTVATGSGSNVWALSTASAHSPTHAWFVQDIATVSDQTLAMAAPVVLSGQPVLRFWHSYTTEATYDGGVVEISANGGAWTDLGALMTQGGYNSTISASSGSPIGGRQAFSGSSGGYVQTAVNLSSYVGQNVQIRFRFATDSSVSSTGWYVDDVEIVDEDSVSNTACVSAAGGQNDCDTVITAILPGAGPTPTPVTPTPTPVTPTPTPVTPTPTPITPTPTPVTPTPTPVTPTPTPVPPTPTPTPTNRDVVYVSSSTDGVAGGVAFADEDILAYDRATGAWSTVFDGSDVSVTVDLNAFHRLADGSYLMSFDTAATIGTLGTVDDSDIVRFVPTSLGANTAGAFSWYFDGSDVGLTTNAEDIDSLFQLPDGRLVISTEGNPSVSGVSGGDEDLLAFTPTSAPGSSTTGTWTLYFDGSDVSLSTSNENIAGAWSPLTNGPIYLSTLGNFSVAGVSGDGADIFICTPGSLGSTTTCTFSMYWDGSANGFAGEVVDDLFVVLATP